MSALRALAGDGWAFRTAVEHDAAMRFERLAVEVAAFDAGSPVVALLWSAAQDERRHFLLCRELAVGFGAALPERWPPTAPSVAPSHLTPRRQALYEIVAASCVTETESLATLTSLLPRAEGSVERALREITRDEVRHAQLGWAHLARERAAGDVAFLSPLVPEMLEGTATPGLFAPPREPALDDEGLVPLGLLPHTQKRTVFVRALEEIVFPGLEQLGVDAGPSRAWLQAQRATL